MIQSWARRDDRSAPHASDAQPRCSYCYDVLGGYEPIILMMDGGLPQPTSRAAEPLPPDAVAMHMDCWEQRSRGSD